MKQIQLIFAFVLQVAGIASYATGKPVVPSDKEKFSGSWKTDPFEQKVFIENKGQMADMDGHATPFVLFKAEAAGMSLYITDKGLSYVFVKPEEEEKNKQGEKEEKTNRRSALMEDEHITWNWERVELELKGATINRENILKEGEGTANFNFFYPHCPDGIYGVKEFEKITIKNVYPGIDWVVYSSKEKGFKYDFIVHPGADYHWIELVYKSKEPVKINKDGELEVSMQYGRMKEYAPESFYDEKKIETKFNQKYNKRITLNGDKGYECSILFTLADFNPGVQDQDLIIDPQLWWATFYGGGGLDGPLSIANDRAGNVFITGYLSSLNFPIQNVGTFFQGTNAGFEDAFILKFDNAGNRLWATYYGGSTDDEGSSIAADGSGNVFVIGRTNSTDFPVQNTGTFFQGTNAGFEDAFILKFDNVGNRLWATYYGGSMSDWLNSITADGSGNVFVAGSTYSPNFPVQNAGTFFQGTNAGGGDVFVLKFDNAGNRLWATYYGGSDYEGAYSIATDGSNNVFVVGSIRSPDFPVQNAGTFFQGTNAGVEDAFILKFDNTGNRLWATYFGGSDYERAYSIATDGSGNVFVAGLTNSPNFPIQNVGTFFQGTFSGGYSDAFILKFDNAGNRLWATYYGGSKDEISSTGNLALDACGNVYMSFTTGSAGLPCQPSCDGAYFDNTLNGIPDIFLVLFSNSGSLLWSSYVGGDGVEHREALTVDRSNNLFVTGEWTGVTNSGTYPVTDPGGGVYYDATFNATDDGYILKFCSAPCICSPYPGCTASAIQVNISVVHVLCADQCTGTASALPSGGTLPYTYAWSNGASTSAITGLCAGTYSVLVTDAVGNAVTVKVVVQATGPVANVTAALSTVLSGASTTLTATGGGTYLWSPMNGLSCITCASPIATLSITTTYCVLVNDTNNCKDSACITIHVEIPCEEIFVPTAFSPNSDGENELECVMGNNCIEKLQFEIYDRWGEKVFETSDPKICWDGTYNGQPLNTAVFVYYLSATLTNGQQVTKKGNVSLIR